MYALYQKDFDLIMFSKQHPKILDWIPLKKALDDKLIDYDKIEKFGISMIGGEGNFIGNYFLTRSVDVCTFLMEETNRKRCMRFALEYDFKIKDGVIHTPNGKKIIFTDDFYKDRRKNLVLKFINEEGIFEFNRKFLNHKPPASFIMKKDGDGNIYIPNDKEGLCWGRGFGYYKDKLILDGHCEKPKYKRNKIKKFLLRNGGVLTKTTRKEFNSINNHILVTSLCGDVMEEEINTGNILYFGLKRFF